MNYVTKDELLDLHAFVITRYGGRLGISSQDRLVGALEAPRQAMFGAELYPDISSKAAALVFLLLKGRPFVHGNQSTALMAMLRFLALNDAALNSDVQADDLLRVVSATDQSTYTKEQLETWMREHVVVH